MTRKQTNLDDIAEAIQGLATHMDERFEQVDNRLNGIDGELRSIKEEQRHMREWLERIDSRLSGVESDIKEIYDRIAALDKQQTPLSRQQQQKLQKDLAALIRWAKEVSAKTGVPLPKL
jgi:septal ring factor EnvC (AmiA/AmiB activator)